MIAKPSPAKWSPPNTHPGTSGFQLRKAAFGNCSGTHRADNREAEAGGYAGVVPEHHENKDY